MSVVGGAVDVHSHYVGAAHIEALAGTSDGVMLPSFTPERTLAIMDENGIEASVLSPISPPPVFTSAVDATRVARSINEGLAQIVADHPTRFGAVGFLPMPDVDATLDQIGYVLDDLGLDGVHLFSSYGGRYLGDAEFTPVLEELNRRAVTVDTHPTTPAGVDVVGMGWAGPALEFPFDTTRTAGSLVMNGAMARFADIEWILPHGGGVLLQMLERTVRAVGMPWARQRFGDAMPQTAEEAYTLFRRFYLDVTWNTHAPVLGALATEWGADHLLFGTDLPFPVPVAQDLERLNTNPDLDDAQKQAVRRDTALHLFPSLAKRLS